MKLWMSKREGRCEIMIKEKLKVCNEKMENIACRKKNMKTKNRTEEESKEDN